MRLHPRRQLFVDRKVQGAVLLHSVMYWAFCLIGMSLFLFAWHIMTGPRQMSYDHFHDLWYQYFPALLASCLLLPLVVIDSIRLTNRFTGPMVRLRRAMRQLANGEPAGPVYFRQGDFWQEFADDFNRLLAAKSRREPPLPELVEADRCDNDHADDDVLRSVSVT